MISRFQILLAVLVLGSCANHSSHSHVAEANIDHDIEELESTTQTGSEFNEDIATLEEQPYLTKQVSNKEVKSDYQQENSAYSEVKRKPSTIAEQQEAARKIQQELASRSPKPDEDRNLENAVFEKVVKPKEVEKPKEVRKTNPKPTPPAKKKKKAKKGWPAIEFAEMKMVFDTINQGDIINHDFIFTNTGSAPLEIKSVNVSCGCTRPSYPFIPIEPNEQGRISVSYNSVGKEGFQNPEITVNTNINSKEIILMMEGIVLVPEKEEGSNK